MKTLNVFLIALIVLVFSCKTSDEEVPEPGDDPDKLGIASNSSIALNKSAVAYARDRGALVIAFKDAATGEYELLIDKLVKKLSDGTPVKYFALRTSNADFGFIRIGQDASGNYKSEAFRTSSKNGKIGLIVLEQAVWYVSCDGSCTFCAPNSDGTACECPGRLDQDENGGLIIVDIDGDEIDTNQLDSSGNADCTFGAGANGLYINRVIY